ncbi:MAG: hypothetical protein A2W99_15505 [Bacteroidetes bacterium GWF2_33_16]|nr:MAG: hypothetical protein A2X00_09715 [Bacteroidetes bacterium GWE2_32_14]OFY07725.1 MAG: hypothetical protein A2W99_15505 [Bacteroidetes bacterium GWF2_33_16]
MRAKLFILFVFISLSSFAFDLENRDSSQSTKLTFKSEFMSQHLWRGYAMCDVPSIEPSIEITHRFLTAGVWSALSANGEYFEIDLYIKYTYRGFSIGLYDYYCPGSISTNQSFLNYRQNSTKHTLDFHLEYMGNERFPVKAMLATMVFGDDINAETNENYFSTYFEMAYFLSFEKIQVDYFVGFNLYESYYGKKPSIINVGIKSSGKINLFRNKYIPLQASIVNNPLTNKVYLVFGFGF